MERLIDLDLRQVRSVLHILLRDRTTGKNIIWATDTYAALGEGYDAKDCITAALVTGENSSIIQPRIAKAVSDQADRTKKHAEVFTPAWICNLMNNHCDEVYFKRKGDLFNVAEGTEWTPTPQPLRFVKGRRWQTYIDSRRLEITCGEAPYLVSRYDASTGELIPFALRIGMLDRKLRVLNENAADEAEWLKYAFRALESIYGFEYQGDNLLIARVNVLMTFMDAVQVRWQREATDRELQRAADIISWNLWQMDGLKGTVPFGSLQEANAQVSVWELLGEIAPIVDNGQPQCKLCDWRGKRKPHYNDRAMGRNRAMKFDFVIGNPPYQEATAGSSTSDKPVYDLFMNAAFRVADRVELITPGRFLFNAGATPAAWNKMMLSDTHFKVLFHEMISNKVFANTAIVGGVAITYRDATRDFGSIGTYTIFPELNSILQKVKPFLATSGSLMQIIYTQNKFNLAELNAAIPGLNRSDKRLESNSFMLSVFKDEPINDDDLRILGLSGSKRAYRFIERRFVDMDDSRNICKYKILLSKSNGASGTLGDEPARMITTPSIGEPYLGYTRTFIGIGAFDTLQEAEAALKYIKSKFCRLMLGVLKVTQDNNPDKWQYVPLQDFTPTSDIDWSTSIAEIDRQLYRKYGLTEQEIQFIETHVKEMV